MSLRKKDVYSTLSDYSRKVLGKSACSGDLRGKSCSLERAILNDKSLESEPQIKSQLEETLSCKKSIRPTPTPPNSPNYKHINMEISIKTIEEPYSLQEITNKNELIDKPKPDRTSFQICKIM